MNYLIYGTQDSEVKRMANKIAKEALPEQDEMNFLRVDAGEITVQEIVDEANLVPLGYDHKVVIVENCYFLQKPKPRCSIDKDQDYKEFLKYLKDPNPDCDIIMTVSSGSLDIKGEIYKNIEELGRIKEIKEPTVKEWGLYVKAYVTKHIEKNPQYRMDSDAIQELADRTVGDVPLLRNSVTKLFLYTEHVRYEDVLLMVARPLEDRNFQIFNFLLSKENDKAIGVYRDLLAIKVEPVTLIGMLGNNFRLLNEVIYLAKSGYNDEGIAKELNINQFRAKILKKYTYTISEKTIHNALDQLFNLDLQIKSGLVDRFFAFELFLINFKRD